MAIKISGLQKLTLLDYPGLVACTIFTLGCNFRCPFCHNSALVVNTSKTEVLSNDDIFEFLKKRVGLLDGVCVTGGEPLIQEGCEEFISKIKALGYKVKLDTNGYHPDKLKKLVEEGLIDCVAMDIKNSLPKYGETVGIPNFDPKPILESISFLKEGHVDYEFRTTAIKEFHTKDDFEKIADLIYGCKTYYIQNFIDSGAVIKQGLHGFKKEELEEFRDIMMSHHIKTELRGVE